MNLFNMLIISFLYLVSIFIPPTPITSQITFEKNSQQLVFYNYTYVTYTSPFALNYSYLLLGNTYKIEQGKEVQKNIQQQKNKKTQFSLDWIIELEKGCPLPNNAKLEIITKESKFSIQKINSELKIFEKSCQDCDIIITVQEYPTSVNEGKKFINEGKITIKLNRNILYLLSKGYSSTYYCLQK